MKAAIVAIGEEVLQGFVVNSNGAYLARELLDMGFFIHSQEVFSDIKEDLKNNLSDLLKKVDLIVATGGLGPTCDDTVRDVAASLFDRKCLYSEEREKILLGRFGNLSTLKDQATLIEGATVLDNLFGTAAGFLLEKEGKMLALLPGVPAEMEVMWKNELAPRLKPFSSPPLVIEQMAFFDLFESAIDPVLRSLQKKYPMLNFGIYPGCGVVQVRISGKIEQNIAIYESKWELEAAFPSHFFSSPSGKIDEALHLLFKAKKLTLALAESCTGGSVAGRITKWPGASEYFLGSFVVYSNALKESSLGVCKETLKTYGAVSRETALEMVKGALERSGSDIAFAITGIAGPDGGSQEKPVGTVCFAIIGKNIPPQAFTKHLTGNRETIIEKSVNIALASLYTAAKKL